MYLSRGQQSLNCVYLYSGVLCDFDLNDDDSGIQVRCLSITLIIIVRLHVCVRASVVRACVCACVRACMHMHTHMHTLPAAYQHMSHTHTHTHARTHIWRGFPTGGKLPHSACFLALGFILQSMEPCCRGCAQHIPIVPSQPLSYSLQSPSSPFSRSYIPPSVNQSVIIII